MADNTRRQIMVLVEARNSEGVDKVNEHLAAGWVVEKVEHMNAAAAGGGGGQTFGANAFSLVILGPPPGIDLSKWNV